MSLKSLLILLVTFKFPARKSFSLRRASFMDRQKLLGGKFLRCLKKFVLKFLNVFYRIFSNLVRPVISADGHFFEI